MLYSSDISREHFGILLVRRVHKKPSVFLCFENTCREAHSMLYEVCCPRGNSLPRACHPHATPMPDTMRNAWVLPPATSVLCCLLYALNWVWDMSELRNHRGKCRLAALWHVDAARRCLGSGAAWSVAPSSPPHLIRHGGASESSPV